MKQVKTLEILGTELEVDGIINFDETKDKADIGKVKTARKLMRPKKDSAGAVVKTEAGVVVTEEFDYTGENSMRHIIFRKSMPRQMMDKESEKYLLEATTHPDIILRGMMSAVTSKQTIKQNSPIRISSAVSEVPNAVRAELRTSSKPIENCDSSGKAKGDISLFNTETANKRIQKFDVLVNVDQMRFLKHDAGKGEISFPDVDEEIILQSMEKQFLRCGIEIKPKIGNYENKDSIIPSPTRGVLIDIKASRELLKRIIKLVQEVSIIKATGAMTFKKLGKIVVRYTDGSSDILDESRVMEDIGEMNLAGELSESSEELLCRNYSQEVADEKNVKKREENELKKANKKSTKLKLAA